MSTDGSISSNVDEWFLRVCAELNEFCFERRVRSYQIRIFRTGLFKMADWFDLEIRCLSTLLIPEGFAFYFQGVASNIWLVTDEITNAYSIVGGIVCDTGQIFVADASAHSRVASVAALLPRNEILATFQAEEAVLVVGHGNFAHFMWNQLPGLIDLEIEPECKCAKIDVINEPILPLTDLLATTWGRPIVLTSYAEIFGKNQGLVAGVHFSIGSTLMTLSTKRRLAASCSSWASSDIAGLKTRRFCLWISVKLRDRHPINLMELLLQLVAALNVTGSSYLILFDGFSEPFDVDNPTRYDVLLQVSQRCSVSRETRRICNAIRCLEAENVDILDLSTLNTPAAIAYASLADFYLCHHGTQQHKIGWIYDVPGVVHSNPLITSTDPAFWVQFQSEGSIRPKYLPLSDVALADSSDTRQPEDERYQNYRFVNVQKTVEAILMEIEAVQRSLASSL